jgi:hypothetical protein
MLPIFYRKTAKQRPQRVIVCSPLPDLNRQILTQLVQAVLQTAKGKPQPSLRDGRGRKAAGKLKKIDTADFLPSRRQEIELLRRGCKSVAALGK